MPFTCKNIKGEREELTLAWPMGKLGCDSDVQMHLERRDAINLQKVEGFAHHGTSEDARHGLWMLHRGVEEKETRVWPGLQQHRLLVGRPWVVEMLQG